MRKNSRMETIKKNDTGAAVKDVQHKLNQLGLLDDEYVNGTYGDETARAMRVFCIQHHLPESEDVDDKAWAALLDATFQLGDRTLYLRMPYFHGNDVLQLQKALDALGFSTGDDDGIFGAYTEQALRHFQQNMGLPTDGIAGAYTFRSIHNLRHSWAGKPGPQQMQHLGFARAAGVLESNELCLFGTDEFSRAVAARMSNLALATNPASKIMSADSLLVRPNDSMLLVHIVVKPHKPNDSAPFVTFDDETTLALRLRSAISAAKKAPAHASPRIAVELPNTQWQDAGEGRSAQHYAIVLLDALCSALS